MKRPIIIDSDPGLDDSIALIIAHKLEEIKVLGITTVAGNASLENTSKNALAILESIGWDIPVAIGAYEPLIKERKLSSVRTGLGNIVLPEPQGQFHDSEAIDFIYNEAKKYKGELEILALGPMTNIAKLLIKYPDIRPLIKAITFMGGTTGEGNITLTAEFNMYVDPDAAKIVFESGIPLTMIGLEVTKKAILKLEDIDYFNGINNKSSKLIADILKCINSRECLFREDTIEIHDAVALASLYLPGLVKTKRFNVSIETDNKDNLGMLLLDYRKSCETEKCIEIAFDIDEKMFEDWIKSVVA